MHFPQWHEIVFVLPLTVSAQDSLTFITFTRLTKFPVRAAPVLILLDIVLPFYINEY